MEGGNIEKRTGKMPVLPGESERWKVGTLRKEQAGCLCSQEKVKGRRWEH